MTQLTHKRLLVKLSGEALMGQYDFGIDPEIIKKIAKEIKVLHEAGVELGLVVGGGNIFRGAGLAEAGLDRVTGDHMGMLATVMNALALKDGLEKEQVKVSVMSGFRMEEVCDLFTQREARKRISEGEVVIFSAGTGNPYFTTDTGASLRAIEIEADMMVKATKVNGIYDKDPAKFDDAVKYDILSFKDAIDQRLGVMDITAMVMCQDNKMTVAVCDMNEKDSLLRLAQGHNSGTIVN
ncbi:MAG: UMP kinase [Gammaproteobacteria bacterium]|nr:UMP kinase [Gammaproteobacteria bacterium]